MLYTFSKGEAILYINGMEVSSRTVGGGLSNWDGSYGFGLANELVRGRGQLVIMGYAAEGAVAPVKFARQELAMFGVCACAAIHYEEALKWLEHNKASTTAIVSHRLSLQEAERGIKLMRDKEASKVCLNM